MKNIMTIAAIALAVVVADKMLGISTLITKK